MAFGSRRMGRGIGRAMMQAARDRERRKKRRHRRDSEQAPGRRGRPPRTDGPPPNES